jgi:hypothetical protein
MIYDQLKTMYLPWFRFVQLYRSVPIVEPIFINDIGSIKNKYNREITMNVKFHKEKHDGISTPWLKGMSETL